MNLKAIFICAAYKWQGVCGATHYPGFHGDQTNVRLSEVHLDKRGLQAGAVGNPECWRRQLGEFQFQLEIPPREVLIPSPGQKAPKPIETPPKNSTGTENCRRIAYKLLIPLQGLRGLMTTLIPSKILFAWGMPAWKTKHRLPLPPWYLERPPVIGSCVSVSVLLSSVFPSLQAIDGCSSLSTGLRLIYCKNPVSRSHGKR